MNRMTFHSACSAVLLLPLLTGCTVDSNARPTLGGDLSSGGDDDGAVTLAALRSQGAGPSLVGDSADPGDRAAWPVLELTVPSETVRHGAFLQGDWTRSARDDGAFPTVEAATELRSISVGQQWAEFAWTPMWVVTETVGGVRSLLRVGPGGWTTSQSGDYERTPAESGT
ncbi:MAG: hypothetical protein AAF108_06725 [Planctomycetota bacterium]